MKTKTTVEMGRCPFGIERDEGVLVLGSCFAAGIGAALGEAGYKVCLNPFGTIFNPASIASSLRRLASARPFSEGEAVRLGAGSDLWGSFSHYTRFARPTIEEFLDNANRALEEASEFYKKCGTVIITFGTSWVFKYIGEGPDNGRIVSNCLKLPAKMFSRELLNISEVLKEMEDYSLTSGTFGDGTILPKKTIYTVSPIRHMADGAHGNQISKANLILAATELASRENAAYFPSYEILLDELRDYSWYAEDLVHPSDEAVKLITSRFFEWI